MSARPRKKEHDAVDQPHRLIGRRVRIRCEGDVLAHFDAGPTAPERVSVRTRGIITIVPVADIEVLP